jgi:hypothetical protein
MNDLTLTTQKKGEWALSSFFVHYTAVWLEASVEFFI